MLLKTLHYIFRKHQWSMAFAAMFLVFQTSVNAQVVVNEIIPSTNQVELKNIGNTMEPVGDYWLCDFPSYEQLSALATECGDLMLAPGELLTVTASAISIEGDDGEMGLYSRRAFGDATAIVDYVEWGSTGHGRAGVAQSAGIWDGSMAVPDFSASASLEYGGSGDGVDAWGTAMTASVCNENAFGACDVLGGAISTSDPTTICVDGTPDPIDVDLTGNMGNNSGWVITDDQGLILALPSAPPFNLDPAGPGVCLIWHISYDDVEGLETGNNAGDLTGCFELSNSIAVIRNEPNGGMLSLVGGGDAIEICAGDGVSDAFDVELADELGANSAWVITDDAGNILALPMSPPFDLEGAGPGVCLVWHLSFEDGLTGAMVGNNASDLAGCFDLSNPITVTRVGVNGGDLALASGQTETAICADGTPDPLDVTLMNNEGSNSAWVITDVDGLILALPPAPPFDLDPAGPGVCLIWHLSFEDGLTGADVGNNASDLMGCFDLSNPITVNRYEGETEGGMLSLVGGGDAIEICAGDGVADPFDVELTGNVGPNSSWVITDDSGNILALPMSPPFDLEGAGGGVCLVWHLSSIDGLLGAEVGNNASDLAGCFDLSNPITVTRVGVDGGDLALASGQTETAICADGTPDPLDVTLMNTDGSNSAWVITDADGLILALPPAPPFDLDPAGPGVCLIWHLSFEDGLTGAEVGNNASDLMGCFDLSNPITVNRYEGETEGGMLSLVGGGTDIEICAGDGVADPFDVELTGNVGPNSSWVITDDSGNILALPMSPPFDLEGAGGGVCLVWHLSSIDGLLGAEVGNNASDLAGCFDLSNPITVTRNGVNGGDLTTASGATEMAICADGTPDPFDIILENETGSNSAWVITDADGLILALPPAPPFDLDPAGPGVCLVWHLSFEDGLTGAEVGNNASDLMGCFNLSNPITVNRYEGATDGGMLSLVGGGTDIEICAGDGVADPFDVELTGNVGPNSSWVITDDSGNILALPMSPPFDLEGAGGGVCLVWHLSSVDGLLGAEVGNNASDLQGCFDLSNPITVTRNGVDGGSLATLAGEEMITICAGDGESDAFDVSLTDASGSNSAWVITDDAGMILALPMSPPFDLDGAGPGTCLVWHLSFEDGLTGAEVGNNASDLMGCFDLSNPITVVRNQPEGGNLTIADGTTEITICAGDGESDAFDVNLTDESGTNSAWVITDDAGMILALPANPPFDLEGAGEGICLVWHLSFEEGLTGAEVGNNASDLMGCFDLSNPITVTRKSGDDCITSTERVDIASSFEVFPNPSTAGDLKIQYQGLINSGRIDVFNILGRQIYTQSIVEGDGLIALDNISLPVGQYIVRLQSGVSQLSRKLIITD